MRKWMPIFLLCSIILLSSCSNSNTHTVTITFMPDGGQLSMDTPVDSQKTTAQVNSNSPQYYPPTPFKLGYTFVNWYLDAQFKTLYTASALTDPKVLTLYAKYISADSQDYFVVTFVSYGGTFTPNQLVESGGILTKPTDPVLQNYTFKNWTYEISNSNKSGPVNFSEPIEENMALGAEYTKK